jgi:IS30 family transposase
VIDLGEWAEIRRRHRAEAMGIKAITRRLGVARNTVRSALRRRHPLPSDAGRPSRSANALG